MAKTTNPFDPSIYENNKAASNMLANVMAVTASQAVLLGRKIGVDVIPPFKEDDSSEYFLWKAATELKFANHNCLIIIVREELADTYEGEDNV